MALRHAEGLFAALDDERVGLYIDGPDVTTLEALRDRIGFLAAGCSPSDPAEKWVNFVVIRRDETIIGRIEATVLNDRAELAYVFGPAFWGHGYASEATQWMIDHLQQRFPGAEMWAAIHRDNRASRHLVERLGLQLVEPPARPLMSYDAGDVVYMLQVSRPPAVS